VAKNVPTNTNMMIEAAWIRTFIVFPLVIAPRFSLAETLFQAFSSNAFLKMSDSISESLFSIGKAFENKYKKGGLRLVSLLTAKV